MPDAPHRKTALRKVASFAFFAAFAAVVLAGLSILGPVAPAHADDRSDAVAACRDTVLRHAEGIAPGSLGLDRIGGGRRFKVWLKSGADSANGPQQFYCLVKRDGTVEELTALNRDGSPARSLFAAR